MSLQKLVGVTLERIEPSNGTVQRLMAAAARHISDARVRAISRETRFVSAYTNTAYSFAFGPGIALVVIAAVIARPGKRGVAGSEEQP